MPALPSSLRAYPSLRLLWRVFKTTARALTPDLDRHELLLMQDAFYGGARSVLMLLDHQLEHRGPATAAATIRRLNRQTMAMVAARHRREH
jgi:hypothetical protein